MLRPTRRAWVLESLRAHLLFLEAAALRHELWLDDVPDPETEKVHLEILGLLMQTRAQYQLLIDIYAGHNN